MLHLNRCTGVANHGGAKARIDFVNKMSRLIVPLPAIISKWKSTSSGSPAVIRCHPHQHRNRRALSMSSSCTPSTLSFGMAASDTESTKTPASSVSSRSENNTVSLHSVRGRWTSLLTALAQLSAGVRVLLPRSHHHRSGNCGLCAGVLVILRWPIRSGHRTRPLPTGPHRRRTPPTRRSSGSEATGHA